MRFPRITSGRARRGINPTVIFFCVGLLLLIVGLVLPGLTLLTLVGAGIVVVYLVVAAAWFWFGEP